LIAVRDLSSGDPAALFVTFIAFVATFHESPEPRHPSFATSHALDAINETVHLKKEV
jgi:hypothetical protein